MRMRLLFAIFWKGMQMDIKFAHIWSALEKLRTEIGSDAMTTIKMEASITSDDPGAGKMIECLTFKCSTVKTPGTYDSFKSDINQEYTLEVFADNENRVPRLTVTSTRDLEKKEQ
jgi:hypothetical protein